MYQKKVTKPMTILTVIFITVNLGWYVRAGTPAFDTKYFQLENGLKAFMEQNHRVPLVHLGFSINVGSRDETAETSGLVHVLEHMLLGDTAVDSNETSPMKEARRRGIRLNAFTSHDVMSIEMTAPAEQLDFALEFIRKRIFSLELDSHALEREKEIILEEISGKQDDPFQVGLILLYREMFNGHPYSRPIGGDEDTIKSVTPEKLEHFADKYFYPSNCALSVVGDFEIEELEQKIKRVFGGIANSNNHPQHTGKFPKTPRITKNVFIKRKMDTEMGHLFLGFWAPDRFHKDVLTLRVLTQILGSGASPLLYRQLSSRGRLVENVVMGYYILEYGGALIIKLTAEPGKIKSARRKLLRFLMKKAKEYRYSSFEDRRFEGRHHYPDYLISARNTMQFSDRRARENGRELAAAYSRRVLFYGRPKQSDFKQQLETVTSVALRRAAEKYLSGKKCVTVTILPDGKNRSKKKRRRQ